MGELECQGLSTDDLVGFSSATTTSYAKTIPTFPSSRGLQTRCHPTRQCPPVTSFLPFHKKPRLILSIALITHSGHWRAMR
ncbi:Plant cysteine oxidase 5 [Zea mays]|uniref:Plant cysteine oxidase 5 n=1 Tax=Zea mays TaxID=4577 RepID=A0A1D6NB27_MAIZE|nr:Plant cysteine oxidase 5 [Zea mays]